jgi:dUTP pyrophosphatase
VKTIEVMFEALHADVEIPQRATEQSACYDLKAYLNDRTVKRFCRRRDKVLEEQAVPSENGDFIMLEPGDKAIIPLGFKARIEDGYEAQIRPRSGLSFKTGLDIPNSPGTIDADYAEEWGVIVKNASGVPLTITHGERIAQMKLSEVVVAEWQEERVLETTSRAGGFGSTGVI